MRVLWICNIMLPFIAKALELETSNKEGWLTGLATKIMVNKEDNQIALGIAFPIAPNNKEIREEIQGVSCFGFLEEVSNAEKYDDELENRMKLIIEEFKPDVIHIFGTEYAHSLAAIRSFKRPDKTLVGIQGICSECAKVYSSDLPLAIQKRVTFRDLIKRDTILLQQQKFVQRGKRESIVVQEVKHITGRTDFDHQYSLRMNPKASYHFMNETLRNNFYQGQWKLELANPFQIFLSQGDYPIKGLHYVIEALPFIKEKFPQVQLVIAGDKVTKGQGFKERIKLSSYGKYLKDLIVEKELENNIKFLGRLNASEMKATYLSSHLFLCPSRMENSPNSVGEAMLLGLPVVATKVGGIQSLFRDEEEGLFYTHNHRKELVDCVIRIFEDSELAKSLGAAARVRGKITHDPTINYKKLLEIYYEINLCI